MKIKKIKIFNIDSILIREIDFNLKGTSFVLGIDRSKNRSKEGSLNSIGKTFLLSLVNFIFGSNSTTKLDKKLNGWIIYGIIEDQDKEYAIKRVIGQKKIEVNDQEMTLDEYKKILKINRSFFSKTFLLSDRDHFLSDTGKAPTLHDYEVFSELLDFSILNELKEYHRLKEQKLVLGKLKKEISSSLQIDTKEIRRELFNLKKIIEEEEVEIKELNSKLENLEITDLDSEMLAKYGEDSEILKKIELKNLELEIENRNLKKYLEESNELDKGSLQIEKLYKRSLIELGPQVTKRLEDVQLFFKNIYFNRKEKIDLEIEENNKQIEENNKQVVKLKNKISQNLKIISENKLYKKIIELLENKNKEMRELFYKQGSLERLDNLTQQEEEINENLEKIKLSIIEEFKEYEGMRDEINEFVYNISKEIFSENVSPYFDISITTNSKKKGLLEISLSLDGDDGEGRKAVRNILMDFILFKFSKKVDLLVHDSSCFSGVDDRNVVSIIKVGNKIALQEGKQYIVSINDFQYIPKDEKKDKEFEKFLEENISIELSDVPVEKKLLKMDIK